MAKWKPPRGCVPLDRNNDVHPEPGVYDFSKLKKDKYQPTPEEIEEYKKRRIMEGIYGTFFGPNDKETIKGTDFEIKNKKLKFPNKNIFFGDGLEGIVKGVETRELNENSKINIALDTYNSIGPAGSDILVYMKSPNVEGHETWEYRGSFVFYGVNYDKNDKYFLRIAKMDEDKTPDDFDKRLDFKFAFDEKRGFYVKEEVHHGTPDNPWGMIYIKAK